ncbi:hypothetical protein DERP_003564 [Dermatophagoides pteronyssinus]|uniref:Fatty acyl-CoA reductase n=1 Tax=Dermatophagoides pteronyssinus TaxID=6956 RepID=A0ABQ8JL04_DERPT|nr:hypothetical protein DERP_003564 [Dermatophagoides pteronyssinus]
MSTTSTIPSTATNELSVLKCYHNQTIFITGVTGFVGKVLLEKILRQCSIERIYVLIRNKYSETSQQRLAKLLQSSPVFALHQSKFDKIHAINGDITAKDLGISIEDRQKLINEVNIVFHSAATISFDGILQKFIQQNIDGTDSILRLCMKMKQLKSIVYVSTAYGNCHLKEIEEKIYPIVQDQDFESYLNDLRMNYNDLSLKIGHEALKNRPNPYTLSKSIAEWMIQERYSSLPIIICRPSIIGNAYEEPIPGWCDSPAGVAGAILCTGLGISRFVIMDAQAKADIIPVDFVVNSLIIAGSYRCSTLFNNDKKIINITMGDQSITWGKLFNEISSFKYQIPPMKCVRNVSVHINSSKTFRDRLFLQTKIIFSHYLFAFVFDLICLILVQKPIMIKIMDRIHKGFYLLEPFSCNQWLFHNDNLSEIRKLLSITEQSLFNTNVDTIEWKKYFYDIAIGCRRYLAKDPDSTIETAKRRYNRIEIIYKIIILIFHSLLYWSIKSIMINRFLSSSSSLLLIIDFFFVCYIVYHLYQINGNIIKEFQSITKNFSKSFLKNF